MADATLFEFLHAEMVAELGTSYPDPDPGPGGQKRSLSILEGIGFRVGQALGESVCPCPSRLPQETLVLREELDVLKFLCKDLWVSVFQKQIDGLCTNHQGTYVLQDNNFPLFIRMALGPQYLEEAPKHLGCHTPGLVPGLCHCCPMKGWHGSSVAGQGAGAARPLSGTYPRKVTQEPNQHLGSNLSPIQAVLGQGKDPGLSSAVSAQGGRRLSLASLSCPRSRSLKPRCPAAMYKHYNVHFTKGAQTPTECNFLDPELGHQKDILTEDDVYCSCLAKTLCHVPVPVTVGFYAPFGCRLHMMLDKITALMQQEAVQRETEELQRVQWRPRPVNGWSVPRLLWYLVFLQPIITEVHLRRKNVKFLFIRFSAWQYAGTDKLWAGLVTTLCEGIRHHYGALPFSVYSVMGKKPVTTQGCCQREWHCRCRVCLGLLGLLVALALGVGLLYLSLGGHAPGHGGASGSLLKVFGGAATTLSGSGLLMAVYSVCKHLFVSQRKKIERLVSREKFGSQLGFMCEVKKEVELLTDFLCFLEIYQRRRLRVVLEVTGLDTCYPERVVGVLNAINTLLSDSHAPFIFILVVDPSILAACLENAGNMKGTADNGYLFLNRTVTLPFSVPVMGRRTKLQFLHDAVQSRDDLLYREITGKLLSPASGSGGGEGAQLLAVKTPAGTASTPQGHIDAEAARRIQQALFCLHDERDCLYEYVPDNVVSMRRIVNTVPITVRLLQQQQGDFEGPTPRQAVAWVVLANQWPCRLSWTLQCLEDRQQAGGAPEGRVRLWDVFRDNSSELHTMTKALRNVLDLDGDPELFQRFLGADFPFTVAEAQSLLSCTVNLDHSIRRRMGLIRAVSALKPQSPPKSPTHNALHAANGAAVGASRAPWPGHAAGHASEAHQPWDRARGGKPKPAA
ncbi:NTPase KAP family P-loop domain-containing protein 1 isoform X3 [Nycticebus coucang]|uniref:NTPase KAP family P-loop domain-containing protein 1 isoform X3 n=1 Tax=Nycticebus coucang TaxID=9470 RepID=UPI00234D36DA|nr:NTPase KAP family P-loop domain-containing protein 1 isoform X3 [Nycticebus coucang]